MTDTDPKLAAIQTFFTAYAERDLDALGIVLAEDVERSIPGHRPLAGTKRGVAEVLSVFDQLGKVGFKADTIFLEASGEYVVDIHRGWSTAGIGQVDTTLALVWHFGSDGKVDRVINLSGDQHQMDRFIWAIFHVKPIPHRLVAS
jgi:ketosteroid isomerase-like protein